MLFEHGMAAVFWTSMKLLSLEENTELVAGSGGGKMEKERYITTVYKTTARKSIDWISTKAYWTIDRRKE